MSPESDLDTVLLPPTPAAAAGGGGGERMGVDEMLIRYCGEMGPWQLRHFTLASLAYILDAFHTMIMIFADRVPAWRCADPSCDASGGDVCGLKPESWEWVGGRGVSTVAEWGLVCGEGYKVGLSRSAFFLGCMLGCGVFGHLSDTFLGRKGSLTALCIINTISGGLTALSPSYWIYLVFRILSGLSTGAMGPGAFVLATEPIGPNKRAIAGMSVFYFFSVGIVILAAMAYAAQSWRILYIACAVPTLLFVIVVLPFVSESPRWYLIRGNSSKAMEVMRSIAKKNGRHLPENVTLVLDNASSEPASNSEPEQDVSGSILDVIHAPVTRRRLVLLVVINFLCTMVYYGLSLNVGNLNTNIYLGASLNAIAEMPGFGITAFLLGRVGRKPLAVGTMWLSGLFCVTGSLVGRVPAAQMACGVVGIFGMAATFNLLLIYCAELFPTAVRSAALGCVQQAAHLGAVVSPMVVMMGGGTALGVFGSCGVVAGFLAFYLPETLNKQLFDTLAGMENSEKAVRNI